MSIPTFAGLALFSHAGRDTPQPPRPRTSLETMPGVHGAFVQWHGLGEREIHATGMATARQSGAIHNSSEAAHEALKQLTRDWQARCGLAGSYVGTDGAAYADCVLLSWELAAPVETMQIGEFSYDAVAPARAVLIQLAP